MSENLRESDAHASNAAEARGGSDAPDGRGVASPENDVALAKSPAAITRERPKIRNVEDFWCWLNTWGDEREHDFTGWECTAYRACIHDAMRALEAAGITYETVPDEAWTRWTHG